VAILRGDRRRILIVAAVAMIGIRLISWRVFRSDPRFLGHWTFQAESRLPATWTFQKGGKLMVESGPMSLDHFWGVSGDRLQVSPTHLRPSIPKPLSDVYEKLTGAWWTDPNPFSYVFQFADPNRLQITDERDGSTIEMVKLHE
jgi:hypothetical protein